MRIFRIIPLLRPFETTLKGTLTAISCLLFSLSASFGQNSFWYDFHGKAKLKVNYTNNPKEITCSLYAYKMFPDQDLRMLDTIRSGSGTKDYEVSISWPQKVTFTISGKEIGILLKPGSTLTCNLDLKNLTKISFEAPDSLAEINDYLLKKEIYSSIPFKVKRARAGQEAPTLSKFNVAMNRIYLEELKFFNDNRKNLPIWYQVYEYWDNRYNDATTRMNTVLQRELSTQKKEPIPTGYYGFLDSLQVNNDAAKNSYSYYLFLYELFNKQMASYDRAHRTQSDFIGYQISQANKMLSGDALDLFKAFVIQLTFNHYKKDIARNYIKDHKSIFKDVVWLNELNSYFNDKDDRMGVGKVPPNFALPDLKDSLNSLKSLKGNVILLSFWYAGCKPCIEEFPAENALAEKFKNESVKIVSICVNTSQTMWKQWSDRFALKTINLWVNAQWKQTISDRYELTVFPKYVLIDKDYKIVDTNAERPSQGLESQINALLTN